MWERVDGAGGPTPRPVESAQRRPPRALPRASRPPRHGESADLSQRVRDFRTTGPDCARARRGLAFSSGSRFNVADVRIGELGERVGVGLRTLRHYEELGLLPARRRANGYREYDERDVALVAEIRSPFLCHFG
jgi:hypothetical protein